MSRKSEVYSWRVSPALKSSLEESARRERLPVSRLLEQIARSYIASHPESGQELAAERRLRERVAGFAGCIAGTRPGRAERARVGVRRRLRRLRRAS